MTSWLGCGLLLVVALCALPGEAVTFRVGPNRELKTLGAARDAVRARIARGYPAEGIEVRLDAGRYELTEPLQLGAADGGSAARPVRWLPADEAEVTITGGRRLRGLEPVRDEAALAKLTPAAREAVRTVELAALGIDDPGRMQPRGFALPTVPAGLELFWADSPLPMARYPNEGFLRVKEVPGGQDGMTITTDDPRAATWAGEPGAWVFGYWFHDWADIHQPIAGVDAAGTITLGEPKPNYGIRAGQRFFVYNVLAELDQPGEWFLDRAAGRLYVWPPGPGTGEVSVAAGLIRVDGAKHLRLEGFGFQACRGNAVEITGCEDVRVVAASLRNIGNRAVTISGGRRCAVVGCDIQETGDGGVSVSGGDRATLTPSEHQVINCAITRYSRWCRTYRAAVGVDGVGQTVAHNKLWNGPHCAILLGGNEHRIEYNEIANVCYETGDVGAFYMGRDWTARGTVLRHNFFHDISGPGQYGAQGVYLDDAASGITVTGNVFLRVTMAMFIGGGRDNLVEGNVFVDCKPALHIDARGIGWMAYHVQGDGTLPTRLKDMPIESEPWRTRYPQLLTILGDEPGAPKYNVVRANVAVGGSWDHIEDKARPYQTIEQNHLALDKPAAAELDGDYQPLDGSPVWQWGFQRIPFGRIGPQADLPRASWPVKLAP